MRQIVEVCVIQRDGPGSTVETGGREDAVREVRAYSGDVPLTKPHRYQHVYVVCRVSVSSGVSNRLFNTGTILILETDY